MAADIKLPAGEIGWVDYYDKAGNLRFIMTSKPTREFYFLYEVGTDKKLAKLGRSKNPLELVEKFNIDKACNGN
ncbi:MAG: hypothetical protein LUE21_09225 [Oscillospiraceae bacterium]|nr:hypothetical protein [Oscillospiraceae bacterium]